MCHAALLLPVCSPTLLLPTPQTVLDFSLSDQVFARARLADVAAVNLWLGAGVMLEYSLEDAQVGCGWGGRGPPGCMLLLVCRRQCKCAVMATQQHDSMQQGVSCSWLIAPLAI